MMGLWESAASYYGDIKWVGLAIRGWLGREMFLFYFTTMWALSRFLKLESSVL